VKIFREIKRSLFREFKFRNRSIDQETFIVLDTETTGLNPILGDKIVSIACVKVKSNKIKKNGSINQLIDPERLIPRRSSKIHGIIDADVEGKPTITAYEKIMSKFIGTNSIVGHNIEFDINFLQSSLKSTQLSKLISKNPIIDTLLLSSALFPNYKSHELSFLCNKFDIDTSKYQRHTAWGDTLMTAKLFIYLVKIIRKKNINNLYELIRFSNQAKHIKQLQRESFGPHIK